MDEEKKLTEKVWFLENDFAFEANQGTFDVTEDGPTVDSAIAQSNLAIAWEIRKLREAIENRPVLNVKYPSIYDSDE